MRFEKSKCHRCDVDCTAKRRNHENTNGIREGRCTKCDCHQFTRPHRPQKANGVVAVALSNHRRAFLPDVKVPR